MNAVLIVTAACMFALAFVVQSASLVGRILMFTAGLALVAAILLPFPAPDTDTGPHTAAVTTAMVMLGFAPLGMCAPWRRGSWNFNLTRVVVFTAVLVVLGLTFLGNWLHKTPLMGIIERIFIAAEMVCLVWIVYRGTASTPATTETSAATELASL
jgi:uncharacterized membrane protein YfcA